MSSRRVLFVVLGCHFISAFAALGMPPFFGTILSREFHDRGQSLAGLIYVLPTLFAALAGPVWGALADRFGKRQLLVRAQLGLAASFVLASYAQSATTFALALALQGLLGGTFAASRAYLGTILTREELADSLTWTEASPRLALIVAPFCLGLFLAPGAAIGSPLMLYRILAVLPLVAAWLVQRLPEGAAQAKASPAKARSPVAPASPAGGAWAALITQFTLGFAAVLISPYFVGAIHGRFEGLAPSQLGLLFGLPHLIYLVGVAPLNRWLAGRPRWLAPLLGAFALATFLQGTADTIAGLVILRVAAGLAMTGCFIGLHALLASHVRDGREGRFFGALDSLTKISAVAGGVAASAGARARGMNSLFGLSAASLAVSALAVAALLASRGLEMAEKT